MLFVSPLAGILWFFEGIGPSDYPNVVSMIRHRYKITVDYERSLEDYVKKAKHLEVWDGVLIKDFPITQTGKRKLEVQLVPLKDVGCIKPVDAIGLELIKPLSLL